MSVVLISKIAVSIGMVLTLSLVAERVSPRVAGLLSGYPLGAALSLFFIGWELGPQFAARSAVYTLVGLVASQSFVYCYFQVSARVRRCTVLASSAAALAGYFATAGALRLIPLTPTAAVLIPIASIFLFVYLFRKIGNTAITRSVRFSLAVLLLRASLAAFIIVVITGTASAVGPAWAGLFSAFPTVLYPLMLIVHLTYDTPHVHTIIKNFPVGLGALIAYGFCVTWGYPKLGVGWGTVLAFGLATFYLLVYSVVIGRRRLRIA